MKKFLATHMDEVLTFFGKKQEKIDIVFLTKIVNW